MKLDIASSVKFTVGAPPPRQLYRVLHDVERGPLWRWRVPEVYPLTGTNTFLGREWQLFTFALNPDMLPLKWRALHSYKTAFTNFDAGFGYEEVEPTASIKPDYVNGLDLAATGRLRYDKCRICGGALVSGTVDGNRLALDYLDGNEPPPALVEDVPIWHKFVALNVVNETTLSRFPQGGGLDVWMALVATQQPYIPLAQLEKLDMAKPLPSPYWLP